MARKTESIGAQSSVSSPLEITLLGTGTSQGIPVIGCTCRTCQSTDPKDKRLRTAAFVQAGDLGLAIDLGPDFRQQMLNNKFSNVHAVLLTHEHNDHISGLDDIRPINYIYDREIPIYGSARSLLEIRRRFIYAFDHEYFYPGKPRVSGVVINDQPFTIGHSEIIPIPVDHGDLSIYGFRIGNLGYITDAKTIPESSMDLLQDLDVLILNSLRGRTHPTHLNIEEAITLVDILKPRQTFFTHMSHEMGLHQEVNTILPDHIRLGYDGLRVVVN